ncbi:lipid A-modifier LpxR family protein [Aquimarina agarivorans]|uniref:lipid A-modifier LpxR family protein n=1 Tax=Aquimarina agarivorans TaxID=980584 RepID=UPI000248E5DE|nr:lipid A-modifier LpxR family protein [Aquimarina agarivorans]
MRINFICCIAVLFPCFFFGQRNSGFTRDIGIVTDNDIFVGWKKTDEFFSFGVGVTYNFKSDRFIGAHKFFKKSSAHFYTLAIKQEAFTPSNRNISGEILEKRLFRFDRPFAGILFSRVGITNTYTRSILKTNVHIGVMGEQSGAEKIQDWFHSKILNESTLEGWDFQLANQFLFNIDTAFIYDFTPQLKWFNFYGIAKGQLGNLYIDASSEIAFRLGWFRKLHFSVAEGNQILAPKDKKIELFYKLSFLGRINAFNATAQGTIFGEDSIHKIEKLSVFDQHISHNIFVSWKHFYLSGAYFFTFERVVPNERHIYGSIKTGIRF